MLDILRELAGSEKEMQAWAGSGFQTRTLIAMEMFADKQTEQLKNELAGVKAELEKAKAETLFCNFESEARRLMCLQIRSPLASE